MFHLSAFFESIAASQTDNDTSAILGQGDFVTAANHFAVPEDRRLAMAYASGLGIIQAKLDAPIFRQTFAQPAHLRPVNRALLPPSNVRLADFRRRMPLIRRDEEIRLLVTTDGTAGPNNYYGGIWMHDGNFAVSDGPTQIVRATGATTVVAGAWTLVSPTYQDQLPQGQYEIVGFEAIGATIIFARIVFVGGQQWRPGVIGMQNEGQQAMPVFFGVNQGWDPIGLGSYGKFSTVYMPAFEVMCNAADTAQTFFLHVRKVA